MAPSSKLHNKSLGQTDSNQSSGNFGAFGLQNNMGSNMSFMNDFRPKLNLQSEINQVQISS